MNKLKIFLLSVLMAIPLMVLPGQASAHRYHHYCHHHCWHHCCWRGNVTHRVVARLRADPATSDQPIWVSSRDGRVMLTGRVGTSMQQATALNIARYTCGVRVVYDNMHLAQP